MWPCISSCTLSAASIILFIAALSKISPFIWGILMGHYSTKAPNFTWPCGRSLFFWASLTAPHGYRPGYQATTVGLARNNGPSFLFLGEATLPHSSHFNHMVFKLSLVWPPTSDHFAFGDPSKFSTEMLPLMVKYYVFL